MKNNYRENLIWLDLFDFLSYMTKYRIIEHINGDNIRKNLAKYKTFLLTLIEENKYNKMEILSDDETYQNVIKQYEKENVILLTQEDDAYPVLLKETTNPPLILYCKGNIQLLNSNCLAIVGTRRPTDYGKLETRIFTKKLAENGFTIVSGMCSGIDTIAHEMALQVQGNTIAVLAGGFHHIYPAININLFNRIIENNLVICENRPDVAPQSYMFPIRNRIIAGLSRGVLMTEATYNSGSIHTRNYAIEYNRDIFAIPGKLSSPESEGCNRTIQEFTTSIVLSPNDILDNYNISYAKNINKDNFQLDFSEKTIIKYIKSEKKSYQELADLTHLVPDQLNAILITLQMKGMIEKLPGNYYLSN